MVFVASLATVDRKSTRLNSSHDQNAYAVFCLKKKNDVAKDQSNNDNVYCGKGNATSLESLEDKYKTD